MRIVIALDNENIKKSVMEKYGANVYKYDILDKEAVIELLSKLKDENIILLTKDTLNGKLDKYFYIKHLKLAHNKLKIVYFVEKLDEKYKEFLLANEVFNIIEGDEVDFDEIDRNIQNDDKIIYLKKDGVAEAKEEYKIRNNIVHRQNIAIFGTSGAGKSTITSILNYNIMDKLNISTFLLDMDIQNSCTDILNNLQNTNISLTTIMEYIDKYKNIDELFDTKSKNNYLTSNVSVYEVQNKISDKYYKKVYDSIFNKFDCCLVDLPNTIFLDVVGYTLKRVDKILFVINPNYISIRQAQKYLEVITKIWGISADKIGIVINKIDKYSLSFQQIKSLIGKYRIVLEVEYLNNINYFLNSCVGKFDISVNIDKIYEFLEIKSELKRIDKKNLKLFSMIKDVVTHDS